MTDVKVPDTAKKRGKIAPAKFAHVVYNTSRYEQMIAWYKTVLEAETVLDTPFVTFISYDEEHHRVAFANIPDLSDKPAGVCGVEHIAYTYEELEDLFATYERLLALDIKPYWCINHGPTLSLYYADPDGNQVELQIDIYSSNEAVNDWFKQSDFATNPIGVKFVPEQLISRFRAGESKQSLLKRPIIAPELLVQQFPSSPER